MKRIRVAMNVLALIGTLLTFNAFHHGNYPNAALDAFLAIQCQLSAMDFK